MLFAEAHAKSVLLLGNLRESEDFFKLGVGVGFLVEILVIWCLFGCLKSGC